MAREKQVGEREQCEHLRAVLGDAAITDTVISKLAFEDAEDVLDLGAYTTEISVAAALRARRFGQSPSDVPCRRRPLGRPRGSDCPSPARRAPGL